MDFVKDSRNHNMKTAKILFSTLINEFYTNPFTVI